MNKHNQRFIMYVYNEIGKLCKINHLYINLFSKFYLITICSDLF